MRQIIKEVLEAEQRANVALQEARQKASEIRRSAEKEMSEKIGEAKQQAREIIQTAVEEAKIEAEHLREEGLRRADEQGDALRNGKADVIEDLVDRICTVILTTECEMDDQ